MMTNAGRTRSRGGELSVQALVAHRLDLRLSYGFTHATFAEFRSGNADYAGKRIPYAPRHTAAAVAEYTVSVGRSWLDGIVLSVDGRGVGPDRMERSQLAAAEILCAGRLRDPVRTTARLAEPLVPATSRRHATTSSISSRSATPSCNAAGRARMGRHTDNQFTT